jgi:hypothetical protein
MPEWARCKTHRPFANIRLPRSGRKSSKLVRGANGPRRSSPLRPGSESRPGGLAQASGGQEGGRFLLRGHAQFAAGSARRTRLPSAMARRTESGSPPRLFLRGTGLLVATAPKPMMPLSPATRIFLASGATDSRQSFEGLAAGGLLTAVVRAQADELRKSSYLQVPCRCPTSKRPTRLRSRPSRSANRVRANARTHTHKASRSPDRRLIFR